MITVAVLIPFTYLGTPKDFWQASVVAAVTSILAAIFVFSSLLTVSTHPIINIEDIELAMKEILCYCRLQCEAFLSGQREMCNATVQTGATD